MLARSAMLFTPTITNAEAKSWAAAVRANGGSVSLAAVERIDTFISAEKTSGSWSATDDYWMLWAENAIQALTSLKQLRLASVVNSPTFVQNRGYTFDGTSNYISTGFIPSTHKVAMNGDNMHLSVYERTDLAANNYPAGLYYSSVQNLAIRPRTSTAGNVTAIANSSSASSATAAPAGIGSLALTTGMRRGTTVNDVLMFKRGAAIPITTLPTAVASTLPTVSLFIGCYNNWGTPAGHRATNIGMVTIGGARTDAQELAFYNAVQALATSLGANV